MDTILKHAAVCTLQKFFKEMHNWEAEFAVRQNALYSREDATQEDANIIRQEMKSKLSVLFETYCQTGKEAIRVVEPDHFSKPPSYDPEKELILSLVEKENKVIIETQQTHEIKSKYMYEMVQREGEWKVVDNRKIWFESESAWDEAPL